MSLEERINADLKAAMLAKDEASVRGLRAIKQAVLLAKTSGGGSITPEEELKMLQKLVKQRKESVEIYQQQGRQDLADPELQEIGVIERYLPALMTEEEIVMAVKAVIVQVGASSIQELGKVMGVVTKQLAGKADNKLVSQIVKQQLGG
ncbi:MAG: GatB/YqeY domain-containing protein [Bacteroidota bacterium]